MTLEELRKQIDVVDGQLVALLNQRAEIVVQVGKLKSAGGTPIYAPDREKAVLDKALELVPSRKKNLWWLPDERVAL